MAFGPGSLSREKPLEPLPATVVITPCCLQLFCTSFGAIYDRAGYRPLILSADQKPLADALSDYRTAGRMLLDDAALGALYYMVRTAVVKPYVDGYGANALWEYHWSSIRILQH